MKIAAQILLGIFFVIFFICILLSGTIKYKLLDTKFWYSTFYKNNVYSLLSEGVKESLNNQVDRQGGKKADISILTDLITPANTEEFVNNNIENIIGYINGTKNDFFVFIPISKIPKGISSERIEGLGDKMTLNELSTKLHISGLESIPIRETRQIAIINSYVLFGSVVILFIILILLIVLTRTGRNFYVLGVTLIICGVVTYSLSRTVSYLIGSLNITDKGSFDVNQVVLNLILPVILEGITKIWTNLAAFISLIGITLVFVKKPLLKK